MHMDSTKHKKSVLPAVGLFFLAPLVAEFLLGNLPIKMLPALIVLAPMYGGGALLIRELVRRTGRGWPSIILLALAYGIVEEAFTTQSLFNPNYLLLNMHLLQPAYIPALRMGAWWTIFVLSLHTAWSISTPIALIEATVPDRADEPWLGRIGLGVIALLFALGVAATTLISYKHDHFVAPAGQFAGAAVVCVALAAAAFSLQPPAAPRSERTIPSPWIAGAFALAAASAVLLVNPRWGWWAAAAILAVEAALAACVLAWSRGTGWTLRHKLALAVGAALAYAWHAFIQHPMGGTTLAARIGNGVFAAGAVALIAFAVSRTRSRTPAPSLMPQ